MMDGKTLPFKLERGRRGCLAEQIAALLREAIVTGYYKPGDVLPPIRELAHMLEVGRVNVERAIAKLTDEGLINPRPKIGSVVCGTDAPLWKGQVLIVVPPGNANHYINVIGAALRDALAEAGYLFLMASVPRKTDGSFDFSFLQTMLRQRVDLVVQLHDKEEISLWLSNHSVPFVRITMGNGCDIENCVGTIFNRSSDAFSAFAEHCCRSGVKDVLQVFVWETMSAVPALRARNVPTKEWLLDFRDCRPVSGPVVAQKATDEFWNRLNKEGRGWLPDVLYLGDDYLATGAVTALLAAGVRIPEDVRVVTWANKGSGCGPVFVKPFTRIEIDTVAHGGKVAECVLSYLRTGKFPDDIVIGPKYIRSGTF